MTKYVVPIDTPPPGEDWATVVPGIYLWDVVGITAQLGTGGTSSTICADATGHGNDLAYFDFTPTPTTFVAGLVAGNMALESGRADGTTLTQASGPADTVDWTGPFTVMWWMSNNAAVAFGNQEYFSAFSSGPGPAPAVFVTGVPGTTGTLSLAGPGGSPWTTVPGTCPADGNPHFYAMTQEANVVTFYVDGVAVALGSTGDPPIVLGPLDTAQIGGTAASPEIVDELATFRSALAAGDIADIFAAASVSFAAYSAAVFTFDPTAYYHFDGLIPGGGRQPTLIVSNGTDDVLVIPTGFEAVTTPGPYNYAWQPGLNADTQSSDGTLTTVAIPALVIPAGYTVGTRTLDIESTDQWSNVALWWDDSVQQLLGNLDGYEYGAGAHLLYHRIGT